jgi:hypothetical protein
MKIAYKLFRVRKDGTLGPLFINRPQRVPVGKALVAEDHPTKGFAFRPGWHVCATHTKQPRPAFIALTRCGTPLAIWQ